MIKHTFTPKSGQQYFTIEKRLQSLVTEREDLLRDDQGINDLDLRDGYVRRGHESADPTSYSPGCGKLLTIDGSQVTYRSENTLNGYPSIHQVQYDMEASTIASSFGYKGDSRDTGTSTSLSDPAALLKTRQNLLQEATEKYGAVTEADNSTRADLSFDVDPRPGHYARDGGAIQASYGANQLSYHSVDGSLTVEMEVEGEGQSFTPESNSVTKTTQFNGTTSIVETSPNGTHSAYHVEDPAEFLFNFWSHLPER